MSSKHREQKSENRKSTNKSSAKSGIDNNKAGKSTRWSPPEWNGTHWCEYRTNKHGELEVFTHKQDENLVENSKELVCDTHSSPSVYGSAYKKSLDSEGQKEDYYHPETTSVTAGPTEHYERWDDTTFSGPECTCTASLALCAVHNNNRGGTNFAGQ